MKDKMVFVLLKGLLAVFLCGIATVSHSNEHAKHHSYMGSHGMALLMPMPINQNSSSQSTPLDSTPLVSALAYHMPLYAKPHDYQLLYRVTFSKQILEQLTFNSLVSILPEKFDLQKMINGESFTVKAAFYQGHFERGGNKKVEAEVNFVSPLYQRSLTNLNRATVSAEFDTVVLDEQFNVVSKAALSPAQAAKTVTLAIHQIASRPSFDAIGLLPTVTSKNTEHDLTDNIVCDLTKRNQQTWQGRQIEDLLQTCMKATKVYIEYKDFG